MERNCSGRRSEVRRRCRRLGRSVVVVDPFPFREREREFVTCLEWERIGVMTSP